MNNLIGNAIKLGPFTFENRLMMAPLTRGRSNVDDNIPKDIHAQYYSQRSGFGLIVTECSQISKISNGYLGSAGIFSQQQTEGWKKVVEKVHENNAKIFLQIWHTGRFTHSDLIGGEQPIAPSPIAIRTPNQYANKPHEVPKEMTQEDIDRVILEFKQGAENAKQAGFDGIQLHAGNGSLVDQFLKDSTNIRKDKYGGSIENRCRFMLEVLDQLIEVYGNDRVSVRITPTGRFLDMYDSDPLELTKYLLHQLEIRDLCFVEVKRPGPYDISEQDKDTQTDKLGRVLPQYQIPNFYETIRPLYKGVLVGNDGFTPETADQAIREGVVDIISFGTLAINNPDFVYRVKNGLPLSKIQDPATFLMGDEKGYIDYPTYNEEYNL